MLILHRILGVFLRLSEIQAQFSNQGSTREAKPEGDISLSLYLSSFSIYMSVYTSTTKKKGLYNSLWQGIRKEQRELSVLTKTVDYLQ